MNDLTDSELNRIQKLCDAATAGPWVAYIEGVEHQSGSNFIKTAGDDIEMSGASESDYRFIASARQDVPRLIAEVRALRSQLSKNP